MQNSGAAPINNTFQQLKEVIQQNMAFGEEISPYSEELSNQAKTLKELATFYKVVQVLILTESFKEINEILSFYSN